MRACSDQDIAEVQNRFSAVFPEKESDDILLRNMLGDLTSGTRTKASVMADLNEAEQHKTKRSSVPGWRNDNLQV